MDSSTSERSAASARKTTDAIKKRHRSSFSSRLFSEAVPDPDDDGEVSEEEGAELQLWKLLPQLKELPESLLKKLPISAMFQLNHALAKEKKSSEKLGVNTKLARNAVKLSQCPTQVPKGKDNRKDVLHPARFLGGASCSLPEQWAEAKKNIGDDGVLALGNYDLDAVGCGGSVTPRGWMEIHNPASQELKLKWFHLPNVANSGLSSKKADGEDDSVKEIADLDSFKMALNTAREAMASALPWNRSICAIVGLMINTNYLQEDLGGNPKRAAVLTEFVDYVLGRNGLNWENSQSFLTTDELAHVWGNWRTKRGITVKAVEKPKKEREGNSNSNSLKKMQAEVCRAYNSKNCKHQSDKDCRSPFGKVLKHVCNKYMAGNKMCLKDHPRVDHV